jgi:hypothetical protein
MQGMIVPAVEDLSGLHPPMLRALQETAGDEGVTYVATPGELFDAISRPARHIEITEHLDLTVAGFTANYAGRDVMYQLKNYTWSIRVRLPCPWCATCFE